MLWKGSTKNSDKEQINERFVDIQCSFFPHIYKCNQSGMKY